MPDESRWWCFGCGAEVGIADRCTVCGTYAKQSWPPEPAEAGS